MINFILIVIILAIATLAVRYIVKQKKKGARCIGCSSGSSCGGGANCHCNSETTQQ